MCDILNSPSDNDKVIIAFKNSKYDKTAGVDEIAVEFHKYSSGVLENLRVILSIWIFENGVYSDEWCEAWLIHEYDSVYNVQRK